MSNNVAETPQRLQVTAFNELSVAQKDPEFQISAQYDTINKMRTITSGGTAGATGGEFVATTGTGSGGFGSIFSNRQIISRPGQGSEVVYTARFTAGVTDSRQTAGPSTASDSMFFGFQGVDFGVFYNHDGRVIVEELTITTPAGGAESTTITIDGTGFTVPLTSGTEEHNAFQIAESLNSQVPLYNFTQNGSQVVARSILANPETGSFSFSSPGAAVAAWSQVSDGVTRTEEFTKQSEWNGGAVFVQPVNPLMINRYKIVFNGSIDFLVEDGISGLYQLVHRIVHTNIETTPIFSTAAFRIAWSAINTGNTTDLTVAGTEAAAFNQGERQQITSTKAEFNIAPSIGTTRTNILTIRCREVFGTKVNLGRVLPLALTAFTDSVKGAIIEVCKNVTFATEPNFQYVDKPSSIAEVEKSAIEVSGGECIISLVIGSSASGQTNEFQNLILPGETLTLSMRVTSGGSADMSASMIWEEDL